MNLTTISFIEVRPEDDSTEVYIYQVDSDSPLEDLAPKIASKVDSLLLEKFESNEMFTSESNFVVLPEKHAMSSSIQLLITVKYQPMTADALVPVIEQAIASVK